MSYEEQLLTDQEIELLEDMDVDVDDPEAVRKALDELKDQAIDAMAERMDYAH